MDLAVHGRRDLARAFADGYFAASGDAEGRALLPLYIAYRATVRGKVEESELAEKEVPPAERAAALVKARAHWLLALGEAETPARRPCLILVAGLPGTGKSTLARQLADRANFRLIRSDLVRKELAGLAARDTGHSLFGAGIYTAAWSQRTYAECLARAEKLLSDGDRVVIDASFGAEAQSRAFLEGAARLGVPALLILCQADPDVVRQRLHSRRGDASDADWSVYQAASARWEEVGPGTRERVRSVSTMGTPDRALAQTLGILAEASVVPGNG